MATYFCHLIRPNIPSLVCNSTMTYVRVGCDRRIFRVHTQLLIATSTFFRNADLSVASDNCLDLPNHDPTVWEVIACWLYSQNGLDLTGHSVDLSDVLTSESDPQIDQRPFPARFQNSLDCTRSLAACKIAVHAQHLGMIMLFNDAIDRMHADALEFQGCVGPFPIEYVWARTEPYDTLRDFIVDLETHCLEGRDWIDFNHEGRSLPVDYLTRTIRKLGEKADGQLGLWRDCNVCDHYHEHSGFSPDCTQLSDTLLASFFEYESSPAPFSDLNPENDCTRPGEGSGIASVSVANFEVGDFDFTAHPDNPPCPARCDAALDLMPDTSLDHHAAQIFDTIHRMSM